MKEFEVIVEKGKERDQMCMKAVNAEQASTKVIDNFYYDGWHVVSVASVH
jgi:hypothetical protein